MPPVFGPAIAFEDALVVRAGAIAHGALAVAQRQQRQLLADQALLDDRARLLAAVAVVEDPSQRAFGVLGAVGHRTRPCRPRARRP